MPSANATTPPVAIAHGRTRRARALGGRSSAGAASDSASGWSTATTEPLLDDITPPIERTPRPVRSSDLRYSAPPTVLMTLATAAPSTVPATPNVDPSTAAVAAASAPAAIWLIRNPCLSSLMIPFCCRLTYPVDGWRARQVG